MQPCTCRPYPAWDGKRTELHLGLRSFSSAEPLEKPLPAKSPLARGSTAVAVRYSCQECSTTCQMVTTASGHVQDCKYMFATRLQPHFKTQWKVHAKKFWQRIFQCQEESKVKHQSALRCHGNFKSQGQLNPCRRTLYIYGTPPEIYQIQCY